MLGLPEERQTLAAFGGSLGARRINAAVADLARALVGSPGSLALPRGRPAGLRAVRPRGGRSGRRRGGRGGARAALRGGALRGSDARALPGGRPVRLPCRRHDGGRALGVRRAGDPGPRCRARHATTRRATPRRWWRPGRRSWSRRRVHADRLAAELTILLSDADRLAAMGAAARASDIPTPPPGWPSWSMPMPADRDELLDLRSPQRIHIVGIGGAGMSAIALVLRAMGTPCRVRTSRSRRWRPGCGPRASRWPSAIGPRTSAGSMPSPSPRRSRPPTPRSSRPPSTARAWWPVRPCWRPSAPPGAAWPWPARRARPRPPRCCPSSSSRPVCGPPSSSGPT
jgi:hypothetical protein